MNRARTRYIEPSGTAVNPLRRERKRRAAELGITNKQLRKRERRERRRS